MVPRHDDRENHDQNQKALGGFGSRARIKVNGRHHPNQPRLMKVRGFFIAWSMIRKSGHRFSEKIMLKTKSTQRRAKCLTIP
jgi:hypothetical protein